MNTYDVEVHPIYGPVPSDGDTVEAGEVLGLSPDGGNVVAAPIAGTVHICRVQCGDGHRTVVRIVPHSGGECSYPAAR